MEENTGERMEERGNEIEISLRDLWKIFLRCWWVMLAVAVVAAGAAYVFLRVTHRDAYTAKASIWVMREKSAEQSVTATSDVSIANNIINDVLLISESNRVLDAVRTDTGTELSKGALKSMLKISNEEETHIVNLSVTAKTPEEARALARAFAHNICDTMNNYLFDNENYTKIIDDASLPTVPSNPISKVRVLIVALVGAVLVYAVFFLLHILDDKVNNADDVKRYLGISVLGQIPNRREVARRKNRYGNYYSYAGAENRGGDAK